MAVGDGIAECRHGEAARRLPDVQTGEEIPMLDLPGLSALGEKGGRARARMAGLPRRRLGDVDRDREALIVGKIVSEFIGQIIGAGGDDHRLLAGKSDGNRLEGVGKAQAEMAAADRRMDDLP